MTRAYRKQRKIEENFACRKQRKETENRKKLQKESNYKNY